jgi:pimeloyl-ACP methyl ester carboxylesterase
MTSPMTSTAILVHGVPSTARLWDGVIASLGGSRRVIALDLPGFAEPPPAGWRGAKEEYVGWLIAQIEAVAAADGPVHLVGHDWGCLLACRAASLRPELLRSLTFGNGPIDEDWPLHGFWSTWNVHGEGERWMDSLDVDAMAQGMLQAGMTPEMAAAISWRNDWNRAITLALYRSAVNVGREWAGDLRKIVVPSLAIWGLHDLVVPIEFGRRMAVRMGAEVTGIEAGHFWPAQLPEVAAAELERHWARAECSPFTILTQPRL